MPLSPTRTAAIAVAALALVASGATAVATSRGSDSTVTACANVRTGALRLETPKSRCATKGPRAKRERRVTWGRTGPQGLPGVAGAAGAAGAAGPAGPSGAAGAPGADGSPGATGPAGVSGFMATSGDTPVSLFDSPAGAATRVRAVLPLSGRGAISAPSIATADPTELATVTQVLPSTVTLKSIDASFLVTSAPSAATTVTVAVYGENSAGGLALVGSSCAISVPANATPGYRGTCTRDFTTAYLLDRGKRAAVVVTANRLDDVDTSVAGVASVGVAVS